MNKELRRNINNEFKRKFGISYDEFELLDSSKQQQIIKKNKLINKNDIMMIGSGEHAVFVDLDDIVYNKRVPIVKKLTRKIRNR